MALGLSGTQASGLWESINAEATMTKHLHSGKAASNGVLSALLARAGFQGSDRVIEGKKGFLASSSRAKGQDFMKLTEDLGSPLLIMRNFFKKHACCKGCNEGIEGVHHILTHHQLDPQDIEEVNVTMRPSTVWLIGNKTPTTIFEAKFSLPFCIAVSVVHGKAGLYQFSEENLRHPAVKQFMRKVKLHSDPNIIPRAKVEVICKDKANYFIEPICRSLDLDGVKEKFIENMLPVLGEARIQQILFCIENLEKIEDINELTYLLRQKPERRIS